MSSSPPTPEVTQALVEAVLRSGTTPNELTGDHAAAHRFTLEAAAGVDADEDRWRIVLAEVDAAYVRILRGQGQHKVARCDTCQQPIRWVRTESGKAMPLDPCPHPAGNVSRVLGTSADVVQVHATHELPVPGVAFRAHFVTCPRARPRRSRFTPACRVCRQPLHRLLVEADIDVHPCCDARPTTWEDIA